MFSYRRTTAEYKSMFQSTKSSIQKQLREETGLIVDVPISGGSGTSNNGNMARRAFLDSENFARILNIDSRLVSRFKIILIALNCQQQLDSEAFGIYCRNTAKLYVELYPWFPMPATVHKILIHGEDIVSNR